ncbi:MAG TPA: hypothetical protein ENK06_11010, partial [Gammaproteobacteria bacterium]|nr:hypothetical protein [Gammaproteobacteria bacterium]
MKKSLACLAFFLISLCSVHAADIAISFSGSTTVTEGQQLQINANLIRNGETDTDAVVLSYNTEFAISEQTAATPNADYQNATGSLSWLARESGTKSFVI